MLMLIRKVNEFIVFSPKLQARSDAKMGLAILLHASA